jgi:transcriptional regulator GlxA family with amidase domain
LLLNSEQLSLVGKVVDHLLTGDSSFGQSSSLHMYSLLMSALGMLPGDVWMKRMTDSRVLKGIDLMEQHIHQTRIENRELAEAGGMAVNSYSRLFREQTGFSPKKYLLRMRVEQACTLLHHSNRSIKEIAALCGFSDRYYFTKIFTRMMKISPAAYRKNCLQ